VYDEALRAENLSGSYSHAVAGSDVDPPGPNNVENITQNSVTGSLDASATASTGEIDLGQNATFTVQTLGGIAPLRYVWSDLPLGCTGVSAPVIVCHPTDAGRSTANVTVTDAVGDQATAVVGLLRVEPALAVTWGHAPSQTDAGATVSYTVAVAGGLGPYSCAWSVNGVTEVDSQPCGAAFNVTWTGPAPANQTVGVRVTDELGGLIESSWIESVQLPPSVGIIRATSNVTPIISGADVQLFANAGNGTGPYSWAWFLGLNLLAGGPNGPELNWTAPAPGTYSFTVQVVDSDGEVNMSAPWIVTVHAVPAHTTAPVPASAGFTELDGFFLISGVAVLAAGILAYAAAGRTGPKRPGRGPFAS
jgi:hypothetical protein